MSTLPASMQTQLFVLVLAISLFICSSFELKWSNSFNYVWIGELKSWLDADEFCYDTFDTSLASIHSQADNNETKDLCVAADKSSRGCSIGLNDIDVEGDYQWSDGTTLDFGPIWDYNEPNNSGDGVWILPTGYWNDVALDITFTFICNAPNNQFILSRNNNYVSPGSSHLYRWDDANTFCETTFGTTLATIHSATENTEASNLCDQITDNGCYIGLSDKNSEGTYEWIDGSVVNYVAPIIYSAATRDEEDCWFIKSSFWFDIQCYGVYDIQRKPFICNAPQLQSCENTGNIKHIDWDLMILNNVSGDQIPYCNATIYINKDQLSVDIDVNLEYLGYAYVDNEYGFGSTYFISLNSFSSDTLDIFSDNGLSECDNRLASSFLNKSFAEKWKYSGYPYADGHIGSIDYLAYPPSGNYYNISGFDFYTQHKCDIINYFGSFSWYDLQNKCKNPQTNQSSVDILVDNNWINLTGTFYINIVSPLYKDIDCGFYRIYKLRNEQFAIAVQKSVHILRST